MRHWVTIQQQALGNFGIVTTADAARYGIRPTEMYRWYKIGRLQKVGYGVYRLTAYPSQGEISDFASMLAEVGEGSYLFGESVLSFLHLCPTRPYVVFIASPVRVRKKLPQGVVVVKGEKDYRPFYHNGIPCQRPMDAIRICIHSVEAPRLVEAVVEAENQGIFTVLEADSLCKEIQNAQTAAQRT